MLDDLEELKTFKLITAHGSLAGVARHLKLTPAAVGKRLCHLEQKIGKPLFRRTTRRMSITEDGYDLLILVGPIIEALEEAENAIVRKKTAQETSRLELF
jgi:LysR family transcriptional activator of dmlA